MSLRAALLIPLSLIALAAPACAPMDPESRVLGDFVNFETIPTRAVALSSNGQRLFATNVPDGRLESFSSTRLRDQ